MDGGSTSQNVCLVLFGFRNQPVPENRMLPSWANPWAKRSSTALQARGLVQRIRQLTLDITPILIRLDRYKHSALCVCESPLLLLTIHLDKSVNHRQFFPVERDNPRINRKAQSFCFCAVGGSVFYVIGHPAAAALAAKCMKRIMNALLRILHFLCDFKLHACP